MVFEIFDFGHSFIQNADLFCKNCDFSCLLFEAKSWRGIDIVFDAESCEGIEFRM